MHRGAWQATAHGITQNRTRLSHFHFQNNLLGKVIFQRKYLLDTDQPQQSRRRPRSFCFPSVASTSLGVGAAGGLVASPCGCGSLGHPESSPEQGCEAVATAQPLPVRARPSHPALSGLAPAHLPWNPAPGSSLRGSEGAVGRRGPRAAPPPPSTFALCFLLPSVPHLLLAAVRLLAEVGRSAGGQSPPAPLSFPLSGLRSPAGRGSTLCSSITSSANPSTSSRLPSLLLGQGGPGRQPPRLPTSLLPGVQAFPPRLNPTLAVASPQGALGCLPVTSLFWGLAELYQRDFLPKAQQWSCFKSSNTLKGQGVQPEGLMMREASFPCTVYRPQPNVEKPTGRSGSNS